MEHLTCLRHTHTTDAMSSPKSHRSSILDIDKMLPLTEEDNNWLSSSMSPWDTHSESHPRFPDNDRSVDFSLSTVTEGGSSPFLGLESYQTEPHFNKRSSSLRPGLRHQKNRQSILDVHALMEGLSDDNWLTCDEMNPGTTNSERDTSIYSSDTIVDSDEDLFQLNEKWTTPRSPSKSETQLDRLKRLMGLNLNRNESKETVKRQNSFLPQLRSFRKGDSFRQYG